MPGWLRNAPLRRNGLPCSAISVQQCLLNFLHLNVLLFAMEDGCACLLPVGRIFFMRRVLIG